MTPDWIVCQIGAREHYAIPRALHAAGRLRALLTDLWAPPRSYPWRLASNRKLAGRWHADLGNAPVRAPNLHMLGAEAWERLRGRDGWEATRARNARFQLATKRWLEQMDEQPMAGQTPALFAYSYAALDLFRIAEGRGWRTLLGQIDPGPEEERLVSEEHERYPALGSTWQPAPSAYWDAWREELELAHRVVVNSKWSQTCLKKEGVAGDKITVVPLVYDEGQENTRQSSTRVDEVTQLPWRGTLRYSRTHPLRILFLGQINLRKGMGPLLEAMRLLRQEPVELHLVGPTEIDPSAWRKAANITWHGPVPRSAVAAHYGNADAFVLPTISDGFALTQLEAMAHGLPVIATSRCGDVVTDGVDGWVVPVGDAHALANRLALLAQKAEWQEAASLAALRKSRMFGLRRLTENLLRCQVRQCCLPFVT